MTQNHAMPATQTLNEGKIVLVVDDEPVLRMLAVDAVEAAGFSSIEAKNADEALLVMEERHDICALFTDIQMPGSMNGLELSRLVLLRWPDVQILIVSGREKADVAMLGPHVSFLSKPYDASKAASVLKRASAVH
jgi:two-component system, response regulator PdtaR